MHFSTLQCSKTAETPRTVLHALFGVEQRVKADPLNRSLHWLPVGKLIFKILVYVHKILNKLAPH